MEKHFKGHLNHDSKLLFSVFSTLVLYFVLYIFQPFSLDLRVDREINFFHDPEC